MDKFTLTSPVFENGKVMPTRYAHRGVTGGENVSVPLRWENSPAEIKSFALACVDLHPIANMWVHWLVTNLPKGTSELAEGASLTGRMPDGSKELNNTFGDPGYGGPQPPKGSGLHRYEFTLYALTVEKLDIGVTASLSAFLKAIEGKHVASAKIIGLFER